MKMSNKIEILFLEFLGRTGIINIKNLVLNGKLKIPPNISHEFTVKTLGQVLLEVIKRIEEIMPQKKEEILFKGARNTGREVAKKFKNFNSKNIKIDLNISISLFLNSFMIDYERADLKKKTIYQIHKCPILDLEKWGASYFCMICEGFCQGIADIMSKESSVKIDKVNTHYELVIKPQIKSFLPGKTLQDKKLLLEKLNISPEMIHQFVIIEFSIIATKIGKLVKKIATVETYKSILFWGGRDAGREIGKMMKRFGVRGEEIDVINIVTYFAASVYGIEWTRIDKSEEKIIDHVLKCPFGEIYIKEKFPDGCMFCEGYCQGSADIMGRNFTIKIPKKLTTNSKYCEFIYSKE